MEKTKTTLPKFSSTKNTNASMQTGKVKKVATLPKNPVTKRDKYMYDLGAEQQAKVFEKHLPVNFDKAVEELTTWESLSRKSLGDRQEPITNEKEVWQDETYKWKRTAWMINGIIFVMLLILIAHPYILSWVNNQ